MNRGDAFTLTAAAFAGLAIGWYYVGKKAEAAPTPAPVITIPPAPTPTRPTGLLYITTGLDKSDWQLDADSVHGPRDKRQGWVVIDHTNDKATAARQTKSLYLVNCDTTGAIILSQVDYAANDKMLASVENKPDDPPGYWPPGSTGYSVVKNMCDRAFDTP